MLCPERASLRDLQHRGGEPRKAKQARDTTRRLLYVWGQTNLHHGFPPMMGIITRVFNGSAREKLCAGITERGNQRLGGGESEATGRARHST